MNELETPLLMSRGIAPERSRWRWVILATVPLLALMFQVYVPMLVSSLSFVELPLLVTLHMALTRRSSVKGLLYGAAVGLMQDALSNRPLGMFGMVKTLVGFFAGRAGVLMDVDNAVVRFFTALVFYFFHQLFYWFLARGLLGQSLEFDALQTAFFALLNAAAAVPLFQLLDRI